MPASLRRALAALVLPSVLVLALAGCAAVPAADPRSMRFPTLPLAPPLPKRLVLENGMVLYLLRDPEVPLVNVQALIRTGAVLEPAAKVDCAELTGRVMRTGGTAAMSGSELSRRLEDLGASLETSIGRQSGTATLSVLSPDLSVGMELLADVLRRPVFDAGEVERVKRRKIEEIRRSNDEPDGIAFREFRTAIYGRDPRGRQSSVEIVAGLTRQDLAAFHAEHFHPDRVILGVSGLFDEDELLGLIRKNFGDWRPSGTPAPAFPVPDEPPRARLYLAAKEFPQATILMGHLAPAKGSPDYFAFSVLDYVLGGAGFNSRLTEEIRSNRGLAYTVGSSYRGDVGYGVFVAYCKSKTATAVEAARLMREIMERMRREGVSETDLRWAKDGIINNLIFSVDASREVVGQRMSYEYDGLPADFLERFRDQVEAVTSADVKRVAERFLRPDAAATVIVGDEKGLAGPLGEFGPLTRIVLRKD